MLLVPVLIFAAVPFHAHAWGPSPSFDCEMKKLAFAFGKQLIPRAGDFSSLYYALDLNDCNATLVSGSNEDQSSASSTESAAIQAGAIFVHPTEGSDHFVGDEISPLRTIQAALVIAAVVSPTPAIVLREGTHFIQSTLVIGPEHSGLHLMGFPGESASISGGIALNDLQWKPYKVNPSPSPSPKPFQGWVLEENVNFVYGSKLDDPNFPLLGTFDNVSACQSSCEQHSGCHAFTWHDTNCSSDYKKKMYRTIRRSLRISRTSRPLLGTRSYCDTTLPA